MDSDDLEKWVKESGVELSPDFVRDYTNLKINASGGVVRWVAPSDMIFSTNVASEIIIAPKQVTEVKAPVDYDAFSSRVKNQKRKLPKLEIEE